MTTEKNNFRLHTSFYYLSIQSGIHFRRQSQMVPRAIVVKGIMVKLLCQSRDLNKWHFNHRSSNPTCWAIQQPWMKEQKKNIFILVTAVVWGGGPAFLQPQSSRELNHLQCGHHVLILLLGCFCCLKGLSPGYDDDGLKNMNGSALQNGLRWSYTYWCQEHHSWKL